MRRKKDTESCEAEMKKIKMLEEEIDEKRKLQKIYEEKSAKI